MSVYVRRFLQDPGDTVLLNIESVNILDLTPPSAIQGVGTGTVLLVGEFENGPYNTPQQLLGTTDLSRTWGTLGYTYGGLVAQYPSAPVRYADGAIAPEFWNGNAFVQISGLQFATLILCRVNTSVGSVEFSPLAYVEGAVEFAYSLQSGQHLDLAVSANSTTVAAAVNLPQTTITVASTEGFESTGDIVVDGQTIAYTGITGTTFTGCTGGTGRINVGDEVVGATPSVATFSGVAATVTTSETTVAVGSNGTNMPSAGVIDVASTTGFPASGYLMVNSVVVPYTGVTGTSFTGCTRPSGADTLATSAVVTAGGYPTGFAGGEQITLAYDNLPNFTVTFQAGDQSLAQVVSRINQYAGFPLASGASDRLTLTGRISGLSGAVQVVGDNASGAVLGKLGLVAGTTTGTGNVDNITQVMFSEIQSVVQGAVSGAKVELNSSGALRISYTTVPGTGAIAVAASTTATGLGFTAGASSIADDEVGGTIPAGTVVQSTSGATVLVTTQDLVIDPNTEGPWSVPVRFAVDDGTGEGVSSGTITVVANPPDIGSFAVNNPAAINDALTESQIDAAYANAIQATTSINTVARVANVIVSARQSNTVRSQLKQNALYASANGCYGRMACVSPPLNTSPEVAMGPAAPGVVATRDQRVIYCYVGANTYVPLIGTVGTAGGTGFTATGNVDVHSDTLMASILSQLPPEENPGQETAFTANVNGIETGANVQGFDISDYQAFKLAGIAALRVDQNGVAIFQSGVTSVDPTVYPQLVRIARRRMADFIEDSIAAPTTAYGKRLSLQARRKALKGEIRAFMAGLLAKNNPGSQRIAGYTVSDSDGNDDPTLSSGMYRITVMAKTLPSLDSIVIACTVGDTVDVSEVLPAAA